MSKFFIERPILANVIAIVTILLGAVCLYTLPVAQYPQIVPPTIQVTCSYAGASAEVVANTIGIPIEQAVNGVENSIYMQSTSGSDGSYTLTVTFAVGTDLGTSLVLVQNAVNAALPQLPEEVRSQGVNVRKVSTNILLIESLYSDDNRFSDTFLANYAIINLENPLARLPGSRTGQRLWRRALQHAGVARSRQAQDLRPDRARRAARDQGAEHPGRLRTDRRTADALQPVVPVHGQHSGPSLGGRAVRKHHRQKQTARQSGQPAERSTQRRANLGAGENQGHREESI